MRRQDDQDDTNEAAVVPGGAVTPEDLAGIRRELFLDALAVARHDYDPCSEWEAFAAAAWGEAALAFGFVEREARPEGLPGPKLTADDREPTQRDSEDLP